MMQQLIDSAQRQRGAAALITVMFLVIVVAFAVLVSLNMSGSDDSDSAYQHNSVQAMFVTESGVERAARLITNGGLAACTSAGLNAGTSITLGSNSFQVLTTPAPAVVSGMCRLRVAGSVGVVTRTVEVDLRPGGGTLFEEHFLTSASFTTNWATQVLSAADGSSGFDAADNCPVGVCPSSQGGGSMSMATTVGGPNQSFTGYRQRNLPTNIVTGASGLAVTLRTGFRKEGGNVRSNILEVRLFDTAGNVQTTLWNNALDTTATWVQEEVVVNLPANRTYNRIRLYFDLQEQGNNEVYAWFDSVMILGGGGTTSVVRWTEVVN